MGSVTSSTKGYLLASIVLLLKMSRYAGTYLETRGRSALGDKIIIVRGISKDKFCRDNFCHVCCIRIDKAN